MQQLVFTNGVYRTAPQPIPLLGQTSPSLAFYLRFLKIVFQSGAQAKRLQYGDQEWSASSFEILQALEQVGVRFDISGIDYVQQLDGPCVFIANHVSMLETMILPCIIQPVKKVAFIVKQSLLDYPVFKHVMRSRDPIAVSRTNPRQDLKAVLEGGVARLQQGISLVVFPQTTRTLVFDPVQFNTIGVKLAHKAQVPVVPIALLTDAWGNGKYLKDFGKIDPARKVYFAFGEPMELQGRGDNEHESIVAFIAGKLEEWREQKA